MDRIITGIVRQLESIGESEIPSEQIGEVVMQALARPSTPSPMSASPRSTAIFARPTISRNFWAAWMARLWPAPHEPPAINHEDFMQAAINLARRGLGQTAPNPPVGCVIVKGGAVVGRGFTAPGGRPHAEVRALAMAGAQAKGATAYVTLEPCSFTGKSGPCTEALISAGISRVVLGATDPHPKVNGAGIAQLRAQHIEVVENILREPCEELIAGFAMTIREHRPLVTLKLASSLDGKIATAKGESQWLTGPDARRAAHGLRGRHDAVLVGVGTVLADDPELTCRIEGFRHAPLVRLVVNSHLRTPLLSQLVRGAAKDPLWILHRNGADKMRIKALEGAGQNSSSCPVKRRGSISPPPCRLWPSTASPACWWRAAAPSPPGCCGPGWWTGCPGSTPLASSARMAGRRRRDSASAPWPKCRVLFPWREHRLGPDMLTEYKKA